MARSASHDQVRHAYRELARRLHPDRQGQATTAERALAERRMREINQAWKVLADPAARRRYDRALDSASRPGPARQPRTAGTRSGSQPVPASPPDEDDGDMVDVMGPVGPLGALVMRGLPWAVAVLVLGAIFLMSAYARAGPTTVRSTTTTSPVGSCLVVTPGPVVTTVDCRRPGALRLVARVAEGLPCPAGAEPRRLRHDGLIDCLVPA